MTRQEAKESLDNIKIWASDKPIQWWSEVTNEWKDFYPEIHTLTNDDKWRIKPEPKLRAWKPEEVEFNAIYKSIGVNNKYRIAAQIGELFRFCNYDDQSKSTAELLSGFTHSVDGGKTWLPCGIQE